MVADASTTERASNKPTQRDPEQNHGRYGFSDYAGCETITIKDDYLKVGDACPECAANHLSGKLKAEKPGVLIRLIGHPFITGKRSQVEKLRCRLCDALYTPTIPEKIEHQPKYDPSCVTALAMGRYYLGIPFKRMEWVQSVQSVPMADSTQWDMVNRLANVAWPIFDELQSQSANASEILYDDTPNRILAQAKAGERKGVYTTAMISRVDGHAIYLFLTSQSYASENLQPLLNARISSSRLVTMCDASPNNIPKDVDADLLSRWIICFCLVHGRRKFYEVFPFFETQCDFVLKIIGKIYHHEKIIKESGLDPKERLAYHQQHSAPLMASLHTWFNNQLLHEQTEENGGMGKAIRYMLRHWKALTRFLHHEGVPIDNSLCEQAIKVAIRHRRNSLFYKTHYGAQVGDVLMSVIHTAARNQINPYDYLNALQQYELDAEINPSDWLPWTYQDRIAELQALEQKQAA